MFLTSTYWSTSLRIPFPTPSPFVRLESTGETRMEEGLWRHTSRYVFERYGTGNPKIPLK